MTTQQTTPDAHEHTQAETPETPGECPFCTYMRSGGCGVQFDSFMDCGQKAEKGEVAYEECYALFEAMRECMKQNEAAYSEMIQDLDRLPERRDSQAGTAGSRPAAADAAPSSSMDSAATPAAASSSQDSGGSSSSSTQHAHMPAVSSTLPAGA